MVDAKTLVKQFGSDPGLAFIEIIRTASSPVRATEIKQKLIAAGVKRADVDRLWKRLQPALKLHPQIQMGSNKYRWSPDPDPASTSLDVLADNLLAKLPDWLAQALVENVNRGIASAGIADDPWVEKEFEKARLVTDLAVAVELLRARGGTIAEVTGLFAEETQRKRLWPIGQPGDTVPFDSTLHEARGKDPRAGATVEIVQGGYIWRGAGEPTVAVKAIVTT